MRQLHVHQALKKKICIHRLLPLQCEFGGVVNPPLPFWGNVNPQGVNPLDDYFGFVVRGKLGTAILNHPAVTSGRSFGSQSGPVDSLKAFVVEGKLGKAISQMLSVAQPKLTLERYQFCALWEWENSNNAEYCGILRHHISCRPVQPHMIDSKQSGAYSQSNLPKLTLSKFNVGYIQHILYTCWSFFIGAVSVLCYFQPCFLLR